MGPRSDALPIVRSLFVYSCPTDLGDDFDRRRQLIASVRK
jgi:hypothetical protein